MSNPKTLTMMIMDPPYESGTTATSLRMIDSALRKGLNVNVFAFEGAVSVAMANQAPHPNPVHATSVEEENHPTTAAFVRGFVELAKAKGVKLDWVNCGFCVAERGAEPFVEGTRKGGPPDFAKMIANTDVTVVVPTR